MDGRAIGWLVGYVEGDGHRWIFATFVRGRPGLDASEEMSRIIPVRGAITRELLVDAGVLPAAEP